MRNTKSVRTNYSLRSRFTTAITHELRNQVFEKKISHMIHIHSTLQSSERPSFLKKNKNIKKIIIRNNDRGTPGSSSSINPCRYNSSAWTVMISSPLVTYCIRGIRIKRLRSLSQSPP